MFETHSDHLVALSPVRKPVQTFSDSDIRSYMDTLLHNITAEFIQLDYHSIISARRNLIDSVAYECVMEMIDHQIMDLAFNRWHVTRDILLFRQIVADFADSFVQHVVREELYRIYFEILREVEAAAERLAGLERFGWDRWRFFVLRRRHRLEQRQSCAIDIYMNLKGSNYGSLLSFNEPHGSLNTHEYMSQSVYLKKLAKDTEERNTSMKPLDIQAIIPQPFWKLVIAIAKEGLASNPFLTKWLLAKFTRENNFPTISQASFYSEIIGYFEQFSKPYFKSVIQKIQVGSRFNSDRLENHQSPCSGANAFIFVLELPAIVGEINSEFWQNQKRHLSNSLLTLPLTAYIPLLVLYSPRSDFAVSIDDVIENLDLPSFVLEGLVSDFKVSAIDTSFGHFKAHSSEEILLKDITWLASKSKNIPELSLRIEHYLTTNRFENFCSLMAIAIREAFKSTGPYGILLQINVRLKLG